jgi:chromosome segregation ATPase
MRRTFIGCAIAALLLVRCSQQADADLANCKSDLTKARDELTAAKNARTEAEQKATALQQQVTLANAQIAQLQNAADAASKTQAGTARKAAPKGPAAKAPTNKTPPAPLTPEERRGAKF